MRSEMRLMGYAEVVGVVHRHMRVAAQQEAVLGPRVGEEEQV